MEKWNYKMPVPDDGSLQKDWNQTLNTKINEIVNNSPITITVPYHLKPIIESLEFYNDGKIGRYVFDFFDTDNNIINIDGQGLEIIGF